MRGIVLVLVVGCGRLGFGEVGAASDGAPTCTFGPFRTPRNVSELNTSSSEYGPWLSDDKQTIYYSSPVGAPAIHRATRATPSDAFGSAVRLQMIVSGGSTDDPVLTRDGLQLLFDHSATTLGVDQQLAISVRASTAVEFGPSQVMPNLNDLASSDNAPSLTTDGLTMVFSSTRTGSSDLYKATRISPTTPFGAPVRLESIDTPALECCPSLAADGSSIVFINNASGTNRIVQSQLVDGVFQPPTELDPGLAGPTGGEIDPMLTFDGTTIVFASDRVGGAGNFDVYIAERSCQ